MYSVLSVASLKINVCIVHVNVLEGRVSKW